MTKTESHWIEVMPRALWVIQITLMLIFSDLKMEDRWHVLIAGAFFTILGIIKLFASFKALAKAMFSKELITDGPYKNVRHPMYVSMYCLLIGIGLIAYSDTWFFILLIFLPIWNIDTRIEEYQMTSLHGKEYEKYKKRTGRFFPK